ncbi:MAG: hypothetical protein WBE42_05565 [Pseudolabrys sp.]
MRPCENRGRVTLENIDQISIVPISGGNAEIDLLALVVGQFVDEAQAGKARMETAAQGSDNYRYRKLFTRSEGRVPDGFASWISS